ncbi:class I SAM-dependent methyltransferase [Thiospirochaeta perfilievii]|uniref:Class I SAM-dependent methyltransferase n=1 Tax=Thiospirochaeta perfilievii TaxID=252967 RepID=A0A5C1QEB8_9SPIO|nr:class I SAM-dependent methyltransferase [Thiospirochaeta perfilievii]QEN05329.1 class I SAM-dependent methyltransferase [Thiospirochaeta perfilievii]
MTFYDSKEGVKQYINMAKDYDGRELINNFIPYLDKDSTVLEIGIGPGKELDILAESFKVTGSDKSKLFLDLYIEKNSDADLLELDAVTLDTNRVFDSIYSNKVLHHIKKREMVESIYNQARILTDGGIIFIRFGPVRVAKSMKV